MTEEPLCETAVDTRFDEPTVSLRRRVGGRGPIPAPAGWVARHRRVDQRTVMAIMGWSEVAMT